MAKGVVALRGRENSTSSLGYDCCNPVIINSKEKEEEAESSTEIVKKEEKEETNDPTETTTEETNDPTETATSQTVPDTPVSNATISATFVVIPEANVPITEIIATLAGQTVDRWNIRHNYFFEIQ